MGYSPLYFLGKLIPQMFKTLVENFALNESLHTYDLVLRNNSLMFLDSFSVKYGWLRFSKSFFSKISFLQTLVENFLEA